METLIVVVWWIGLLGALLATLVILKEVVLVVRALRDILQLAERARLAAVGIADHAAGTAHLDAAGPPSARLSAAAAALAQAAGSLQRALGEAAARRQS
jgi:uncharacterized membrane protein YcjF (UPF0283 family)